MSTEAPSPAELERELAKLRKINEALMARVERSMDLQDDAFSLFQAATTLEKRVRERTAMLEQALTDVEVANRDLQAAKEQADAANRAKSEFLANMSHEIRPPMNGVLGMTELLATTELTGRQQRFVRTIQQSARSLLVILNDILDFSKIEAGRLVLEDLAFDLREAVQDTVALLVGRATTKGIRLDCEIADDVPRAVHGDPARLRQVITNLVGNAVKFTHRGRVAVHLARDASLPDGIRLAVEDTGIGIAAEVLPTLFRSFSQADGSMARKYGGTGLGLAITKNLVTMMGGRVDVQSTPGVGSVFSFVVPLRRAADEALADLRDPSSAAASAALVEDGLPKGPDPRQPAAVPPLGLAILVAEDNEVNQEVCADMLALCGCSAHMVGNGQQALAALASGQWDVVLMDCQMPEMDGFDTTRAIRAHERERTGQLPIPVIALTANAMDGDEERCRAAGMDDYLSKPFDLHQIWGKLDHWRGVAERRRTAAGAGRGAAIDPAAIESLRRLRPGRTGTELRVVQTFLATSGKLMTQLRTAVQAGDARQVYLAAHTLKSGSAYVGAHAVQRLATDLERAGRDQDLAPLAQLMVSLEGEFRQATDELNRLLAELGGPAS